MNKESIYNEDVQLEDVKFEVVLLEVVRYIEKLYYHLNSFMQFTRQYNESKNKIFGLENEFERSSSELINIRDSFMHFILFYEASENGDYEQEKEQWDHIQEHGHRAAKDQFVFFCQKILEKDLREWLQLLEEDGQYPEAIKATRKLMHEVKNAVMDIRTSSANGIRITDERIKKSISNLESNQKDFCDKYYQLIKEVYDKRVQGSIK